MNHEAVGLVGPGRCHQRSHAFASSGRREALAFTSIIASRFPPMGDEEVDLQPSLIAEEVDLAAAAGALLLLHDLRDDVSFEDRPPEG